MKIANKKRAVMLIADGLGDRPIPSLGNKTPLEYASTPTLDELCKNGISGLIHPYRPGAKCGTDWGHLCLFGYDPAPFYTGRGSIEAASAGIRLQEGDVAFRGNFATVADDFTVADRRAGRISEKEDIDALLEAIQDITIDGCSFLVRSLTEHRLALVMRGAGLSGKVANTDPGTACEGQPVNDPRTSCAPGEERTARILWEFLQEVHARWQDHPVNQRRLAQGKLPANFILTRGSGSAIVLPPFAARFPGARVACIAGDVTITGIAEMCGFEGYTQSSFTGGFDSDYAGKARKAVELLQDYDLVIVHVKATDLCGHDDLPLKKAEVIEKIDGMYRYILENTDPATTYYIMTADHSTPCQYREHSADPVPSFFCGPDVRTDSVQHYGERACGAGLLNQYTGAQLMATIMDYLGFNPKFGA